MIGHKVEKCVTGTNNFLNLFNLFLNYVLDARTLIRKMRVRRQKNRNIVTNSQC